MATPPSSTLLKQINQALAISQARPDQQLLQDFVAQKDEGAFVTLLKRHGPMVLGICRRVLHDSHEAEDAFQATFLVLARKAGSIRKREAVGSWLYGVACRLAQKAKAAAQRRPRPEAQVTEAAPAAAPAEAAWNELRGLLDEELNRLPEKYRAPLLL